MDTKVFEPGDRVRVTEHYHGNSVTPNRCLYAGLEGTIVLYLGRDEYRVQPDSGGRTMVYPARELEFAPRNVQTMVVDPAVGAMYLHTRADNPDVEQTLEATVNVDFDSSGNMIGIEFTTWPISPSALVYRCETCSDSIFWYTDPDKKYTSRWLHKYGAHDHEAVGEL